MSIELLRELGRGGMATVYLGRDRHLGREVAVKVLHESLLTDDEAVSRFEREARVVAKLEHPNILGLYGLEEVKDGRLGLVMPYVRGGTLAERLEATGEGLPVAEVVHITRAVLQGLAYAHHRGVVHRDIKPGNVFLGEQPDRALVADFGIARAAGAQTALTQTGASMGTPNYMAPEQIDSVSDVDGRADLYAVGMMMWEMLTGERPWREETLFNVIFKQKIEDLESPKKRRPEIPDALIEVWRTATRKDCDDRWPSAGAMLEALQTMGGRRSKLSVGKLTPSAADRRNDRMSPIVPRAHLALDPFLDAAQGAPGHRLAASNPPQKARKRPCRRWRGRPYIPVALMVLFASSFWFLHTTAFSERAPSHTSHLGTDFGDEQFAWIPQGSFQRGSVSGFSNELPAHSVTISHPLLVQRTPVTQRQWREVMGDNPSHLGDCGETCPVENVSWYDVQRFLQQLNHRYPGHGFRLPTEAEWEYAARAGTTGDFGGTGVLDQMGWYMDNSENRTHPVARKRPNAWGLYDMHGNVGEWVEDWYGPYDANVNMNPTGPPTGSRRVVRGGSFFFDDRRARSASRVDREPSLRNYTVGFRLVKTR